MGNKKDRDLAIEALRWIAILAVVFHHGISLSRHSQDTIEVVRQVKAWLGWCVPAFLAVSGAFVPRGRPFLEFVSTRARRLLVPFVSVSTLSWMGFSLIAMVFHLSADAHLLDFQGFLLKMVFLEGFGPQLYFLTYLFFVACIWRGLSAFLSWGAVVGVLVCFLVAQCHWFIEPLGLLGPGLDKPIPYALCFALGAWLYQAKSESRLAALSWLVVLSAAAGTAAVLLHAVWPIEIVAGPWIYVALTLLKPGSWIPKTLWEWNSAAVYLWHAPIILMGFSVGLDAIGVRDGWNFVASCILSVPSSLVLDKFVSRTPLYPLMRL
ncbi:MAG TPA: acyltransferase [Fibrobacteria bacterium]|nr:acyltransferase [Fibrobacteria bacterium]